jgi:hypothetical protein
MLFFNKKVKGNFVVGYYVLLEAKVQKLSCYTGTKEHPLHAIDLQNWISRHKFQSTVEIILLYDLIVRFKYSSISNQ